MKLNKIYTRIGDLGKTSLVYGEDLSKSDFQIEAFGLIDQVNSNIGMVRTLLTNEASDVFRALNIEITQIQQMIFDAGSSLSYPINKLPESIPKEISNFIPWLENSMDLMQKDLAELQSFVLPGGSFLNSWLHQCRTSTRTAERMVVRFSLETNNSNTASVIMFLNRLSDWFFVASRFVSKHKETPEYLWERPLKSTK